MNTQWRSRALACLLACLAGAWPVAGWAQDTWPAEWPTRVGRVVEGRGTVQVFDRDEREWVPASPNRPLAVGDRLRTGEAARAEVRIGSTVLRLAARTDIELQRLDEQALAVQLLRGTLALKLVAPDRVAQTEVLTQEGHFRPRQPGHYRIGRLDEASHASAWRGELGFEGRDSALVIPAGRHAELWLEGPARVTHYQWRDLERDDFANWVAYDDTQDSQSETARHVSPEMTGWEELDRYGAWQVHPDYGSVWIPASVPSGWAPYQDGRWVWVAPWGWTWVDRARWGFAPFHYGRWVHWSGRWCWVPGPRQHRPAFAPALVGGFDPARGGAGSHRGAPPVNWAPLGPREVYRPWVPWRGPDTRPGRDQERGHERDRDKDRDRDRDRGRETGRDLDRGTHLGGTRGPAPRGPGTVADAPLTSHAPVPPGGTGSSPRSGFVPRTPAPPTTAAPPTTVAPPPPAPPSPAPPSPPAPAPSPVVRGPAPELRTPSPAVGTPVQPPAVRGRREHVPNVQHGADRPPDKRDERREERATERGNNDGRQRAPEVRPGQRERQSAP